MTNDEINRAIAEFCGWREAFPKSGDPHPEIFKSGIMLPYRWVNEKTHERVRDLPDYFNDLNAIHEAEESLTTNDQVNHYEENLKDACGGYRRALHAGAQYRSKAFLKTIGKWR